VPAPHLPPPARSAAAGRGTRAPAAPPASSAAAGHGARVAAAPPASSGWPAATATLTRAASGSPGAPARAPSGSAALLLAAASLAAAAHSLARLGRAGRRRHRLGPDDPGEAVRVSVVVPARDEAARIQGCVAALLAQDVGPAEVVVVDDGSRDATAELAARAGARVVAAPRLRAGQAGKAAACAAGADAARAGEWLAFVDADVRLVPQALSRLVAAAAGAGAAAASPLARPVTGSWWEELLVPELGLQVAERLDLGGLAARTAALPARPARSRGAARPSTAARTAAARTAPTRTAPTRTAPARPPAPWRAGRSSAPAGAFLSGQCLLVRRDAYDAVGGFAAVADSLVEDVALARLLAAAGHGLEVQLAPGLAAVRMYERPGDLREGLARSLAEVWGSGPGPVGGQAARALLAVLPWVALAVPRLRPARPGPRAALLGAGLLHLATRAGGRWRAGADPRWALAYPAADAVLLAVYLDSVRRQRTRRPVTWKGRAYPAGGNRPPGSPSHARRPRAQALRA
jgi:GT2 family glycosyltransferase